ncbi:hypothetical protein [Tenacibaculum maritimum]|uniref:hypothetical protein n=1 Tax=Tenacibaculum maritimum TaxID=107401 RepID=UPI0012E434F1|nr:hypothetical protein [Tenacibaculum maritimum]CAA0230130.1 conserved hypothetical protein [Tenacibaculum maritimum]CAA0250097.1 conserved hypothetical protein [Tenacibaculum maritimum]
MKIKLKFSVDQIIAISKLLNQIYEINFNSLNTEEKLEISIGMELSDVFDRKKRNIQKKNDLFNNDKKIAITLKYHEAWGLKNIFINRIGLLDNEYQKLNIQTSINHIDRKTC